MSFSVNPGTFQSMQIETEKGQKFFLAQLSSLLTQMTTSVTQLTGQVGVLQSATGLAAILNGSGSLAYNALRISASSLGAVSTNQTINCNSAAIVAVSLSFGASITLTLNNLGIGVPVAIATSSGGAFTLKMAATLPGGSAYTVLTYLTGGAATSLITTGWVAPSGAARIFTGITNAPSYLQMAFV